MSHKVKKDEEKRKNRGPTFNGFAPKIQDTKKYKAKKRKQKHKKDLTNSYDYDIIWVQKERKWNYETLTYFHCSKYL